MAAAAIRVRGLRELQASLRNLNRDFARELAGELRAAAEPVRADAEQMASQRIRNIGPKWSQMRTGVTNKVVYVAPRSRRRGGSPRPNLAGELMGRAMEPALERHSGRVTARLERLIDGLADRNGF